MLARTRWPLPQARNRLGQRSPCRITNIGTLKVELPRYPTISASSPKCARERLPRAGFPQRGAWPRSLFGKLAPTRIGENILRQLKSGSIVLVDVVAGKNQYRSGLSTRGFRADLDKIHAQGFRYLPD